MAGILEIDYADISEIPHKDFSGIIIVDSQPGAGNISVPDDLPVYAVLDHHNTRNTCDEIDAIFCDIRPDYGSTSTIIYEYLKEINLCLDENVSTALLLGIRTDTENLERDCSNADIEAYLDLYPQSNRLKMSQIINPALSLEYFSLLKKALNTAKSWGDIVVINLNAISAPDVLSEISELFLRMKGINISLACGIYDDSIYFSIRTKKVKKSLLSSVKEIAGGDARAGGHGNALGGNIPGHGMVLTEVSNAFCQRFVEINNQLDNGPRPVCLLEK
jgi:nanoRNase/pAp phosphatase (c-di-AMP/oligoRNAs hydrolase)